MMRQNLSIYRTNCLALISGTKVSQYTKNWTPLYGDQGIDNWLTVFREFKNVLQR